MSNENHTSIFKKLNAARKAFRAKVHTKSGKNPYFTYFEAEDFIPDACEAYENAGICGVISYTSELATHTTTDVDDITQTIVITCPWAEVKLAGCHPAQNTGASMTYFDRYLWKQAIQLAEKDLTEATTDPKKDTETLPKDKNIAKRFPAVPMPEKKAENPGRTGWIGTIAAVKTVEGSSPKGPWKLFWVEMENGDSAGTFDEVLAKDAEIMAGGAEVRVLVEPNPRKPGTWKYLGFEEITPSALEPAGREDLPWK